MAHHSAVTSDNRHVFPMWSETTEVVWDFITPWARPVQPGHGLPWAGRPALHTCKAAFQARLKLVRVCRVGSGQRPVYPVCLAEEQLSAL